MQAIRIIPRLDIKGPNLVKGIHLEGLRVLGKPREFAKHYYKTGADEIVYVDIVASLYERNSLDKIIQETVKEIFIPITVGGGIRSLDDIKKILRLGADKVIINTAAVRNPNFISQAANAYGSSTVAVSIEAIKQPDANYQAFTDNGREHTGKEVVAWAEEVAKLGAGEITILSVDQEGTGEGYDLELIKKITNSVNIPVVAAGGAKNPEDISNAILKGNVQAVSMSSVLHYGHKTKFKNNKDYSQEGVTAFIENNWKNSRIKTTSIPKIKKCLVNKKISIRTN